MILIYTYFGKKMNVCMLDTFPVSTYFLILCKPIGIQVIFVLKSGSMVALHPNTSKAKNRKNQILPTNNISIHVIPDIFICKIEQDKPNL